MSDFDAKFAATDPSLSVGERWVRTITGYTQEQLQAAFELVQNPNDWKAPIDSYCTTEEVHVVAEAVLHFTATKAQFDYIGQVEGRPVVFSDSRFSKGDHIMKVRADGYRAGPAGDH